LYEYHDESIFWKFAAKDCIEVDLFVRLRNSSAPPSIPKKHASDQPHFVADLTLRTGEGRRGRRCREMRTTAATAAGEAAPGLVGLSRSAQRRPDGNAYQRGSVVDRAVVCSPTCPFS
jgi:hypothetical protein